MAFNKSAFSQANVSPWDEKQCLNHAQVSYQLMDLSSGKILQKHNENQLLAPASTAKLLTTATALHFLGDTFKTKTQVFLIGNMSQNGLWKGDLVFKGFGDLGLSINDNKNIITETIEKLKNKGIFAIEGKLIVDPFYFDYNEMLIPNGYTWEDMGNYYASPNSAFSVNQNAYSLFFKKGLKGDTALIQNVVPSMTETFFDIQSHVTYGAAQSGDQAWIYAAPLGNQIFIRGTIPEGVENFEIKGSIPDPASFYAEYFLNLLNTNGISVHGVSSVKKTDVITGEMLVNWPSAPLSEWIKEVNQNSNNFYAEMLLCHLGKSIGKPNYTGGIEVVKKYINEVMKNKSPVVVKDGSGLSPINAQSAAFQTEILNASKNNEAFVASLAISGELGTLKNSFTQAELKGKLKGKSGSIAGVLAYAFYFESKSGKPMACSFIVNHHDCKSAEIKELIAKQIIKWKQAY